MSGPQVRPRACTSAPPSLSFPSLTGANPSCLAKSATGAIASSSSLDRKTTRCAALDERIGRQGGSRQMIKTFHQLGACDRLRDDDGGRESAQLFKGNSIRVRRVDDRLAFPTRQGLRNLAVLPERDRQDDCVGLECIPQRLGDDRGSNRQSLRRQRLGWAAARDGHVDVFTGKRFGKSLDDLAESDNCVAHILFLGLPSNGVTAVGVAHQSCARPPSTATSLAVMKLLSDDARKAATAPISAGSAMRWSGVIAA